MFNNSLMLVGSVIFNRLIGVMWLYDYSSIAVSIYHWLSTCLISQMRWVFLLTWHQSSHNRPWSNTLRHVCHNKMLFPSCIFVFCCCKCKTITQGSVTSCHKTYSQWQRCDAITALMCNIKCIITFDCWLLTCNTKAKQWIMITIQINLQKRIE